MEGQSAFDLDTDSFFTEKTWQKQPQRSSAKGAAARLKKNARKPLAGLSINTSSSPSTPPTYESRLQGSYAVIVSLVCIFSWSLKWAGRGKKERYRDDSSFAGEERSHFFSWVLFLLSLQEPSIRMADLGSNEKPLGGHAGGDSHSPYSGDILSSGLDRLGTFMMRGSVAVTQAVEKFVERTATDFATTFDMADAIPAPDGQPRFALE